MAEYSIKTRRKKNTKEQSFERESSILKREKKRIKKKEKAFREEDGCIWELSDLK